MAQEKMQLEVHEMGGKPLIQVKAGADCYLDYEQARSAARAFSLAARAIKGWVPGMAWSTRVLGGIETEAE